MAEVTARDMVTEAIQHTLSTVIGAPVARSRLPRGPLQATPFPIHDDGRDAGDIGLFDCVMEVGPD